MPSKVLLSTSALFLGILGIAGTFIPAELLHLVEKEPVPEFVIVIQIMGGLYLGFALLNWMNRTAPMGGIYGKPVAMANLLHFLVVGLMLIKEAIQGDLGNAFIFLSVLYSAFALGFASTLFFDPFSRKQTNT